MAKTHFVHLFVILIFLCANQSVTANFEDNVKSDSMTGLLTRKIDVDRQGGIGGIFSGPLAIAAFLFSLPLLPALLMAPLAVAGLGPTIGAVGNFMSTFGGGSSGIGSISSLLRPPNAGSSEAASNADSSTGSTGSSTGFGSVSPIASALRSISDFLFARRFSYNSKRPISQSNKKKVPIQQSDSSDSKPEESGESAQSRFGTLMTSLKEVYGILKSGLRRYEITDTDCQSRLICEVHQKAAKRSSSIGSITASLLDLIGVESHLDRSNAFSDRAKSVIKDFVRAAKTGLSNNDCALVFNRCPSNVPPEPHVNKISGDYYLKKPHIFNVNQLLHSNIGSQKPNRQRPAIQSSIVTTPRTVYYSNANKL